MILDFQSLVDVKKEFGGQKYIMVLRQEATMVDHGESVEYKID